MTEQGIYIEVYFVTEQDIYIEVHYVTDRIVCDTQKQKAGKLQ